MVDSIDCIPDEIRSLNKTLRFRNTILVFIEVDKEHIFDDNWLYIHSPEVATGRIANFANWSEFAKLGRKETILCLEYWANNNDPLWQQSDDSLIAQAKADLKTLKFATDAEIKRGSVLKIEKSYPIYESGYQERLNEITKYLDAIEDLYFIGRNGSFKYNNQDHSILMGLLCADKIQGKYQGSLWDINTDSNYQEEGKISK